jgi:uncharacterized protein (TIGR01777 family)
MVGSALVPVLERWGHEVVRLVRREARGPGEVSWDPAAGQIDTEGLSGIEAAVHLSGANVGRRWTDRKKREIRDSHVQTTDLLARTLAALDPRPGALVCAGGIDVYGERGDEILTEESDLGTYGLLTEVGIAKEQAAEPAREAGIRVVNFRQAMVLSRDGGALKRMLTPFQLGVGGRVGSGRAWWSWVALDDVVAAYRFALERDLTGPVNLVSPNPVRSADFVKSLGRALRRPTVFPLPALGVKLLFGEMGETVLLESHRVLPARLLDAGFTFTRPDLDEALATALA